MQPGDRKSVAPMAARVEPGRVRAAHQSLHHFVAKADWADTAVVETGRDLVLPVITRNDPGLDHRRHRLPKKGTHSVGVARQYRGQLGKQDNCQVAVSLSIANEQAFPWPGGSICQKPGLRIGCDGRKPAFQRHHVRDQTPDRA